MPLNRLKTRKGEDNPLLAFKFLALFLVLAGIAYFALSLTQIPNHIAAYSSQLLLKIAFNIDSSIAIRQFPVIQTPNLSAQIIDLCSGSLELAILFGIVFGSFEKKMNYRINGFLVGMLVLLAFNAVRISTSIYFLHYGGLEWGVAVHDVLFRIFLIVVIVTYYSIWYFYDQPRKKRKKNKR
ncbi:MAG: exosortase/archaeosortase family protein [Candidatus Micrarchaeota archaeon]